MKDLVDMMATESKWGNEILREGFKKKRKEDGGFSYPIYSLLTDDSDVLILLLGVEGSVRLGDLTPEGARGGQLGVDDVDAVLPGVRASLGQAGVVGVHHRPAHWELPHVLPPLQPGVDTVELPPVLVPLYTVDLKEIQDIKNNLIWMIDSIWQKSLENF